MFQYVGSFPGLNLGIKQKTCLAYGHCNTVSPVNPEPATSRFKHSTNEPFN